MKTAFLFPGQGAQKVGMGKSFFEADTDARQVYERASEYLGLDMQALCFEQNDKLDFTEYTQAAMVTTGIAILQSVKKYGIHADVSAGLSLGEYEALYYSKILSEEDAIKTVRKRGILMAEAVPADVGAMSAVLNLDAELIEECIREIDGVWIANYNCPGQIVISGKKEAVDEAGIKLKEAGAKRVLPLRVSGPFHSKLLFHAGELLHEYLQDITIYEPALPYVANYHADFVTNANEVKELLCKQVYSSVRFEQSIRNMIKAGVDTFVEIGPGKTLSGFVKKIDTKVRIFSIETMEELEATAKVWNS